MPSLARKRVHPHTMRHTAAVHLLQAGVDMVSISHWLGHQSVETTNRYATIDLETKRKAVTRAGPIGDDDVPTAWRSRNHAPRPMSSFTHWPTGERLRVTRRLVGQL